ncbi:MAG: U32 family peptidase [Proteobacteria bacterium]|nr:U32 family peptidase [Pseudomonadota bacterium]MDA1021932.1 U32 family peptidase [Pseudomonadota bacterium]
MTAKLSLGPVLFNWDAEVKRDFYFHIADEAPFDTVYLGEVVCSKRTPFFEPFLPEVIERLQRGGKEVVLSTLALIMSERELDSVRALAGNGGLTIEANDMAAVSLLAGRDHVIGPFVNVYNEGSLEFLENQGARRVSLPWELPSRSLSALASFATRELEVQAFGRAPLAISARCYHARSHGLHKDGCQFVCIQDPNGMEVQTLDGKSFLSVNGPQTLSHSVLNLISELEELQAMGIDAFRLWPHMIDMAKVAEVFRDVLDGTETADEGQRRLDRLVDFAPFSNGFYYGQEGAALVS